MVDLRARGETGGRFEHVRIARPLFLLVVFVVGGWVGTVQAQEFGRIEDTKSNVAYFYHAEPGEATVQVSVWGTIPRPGIYEITDTTAVDKLLTMAGGASMEPRREGEDPPEITVRVFRPRPKGRALLLETPLEKMLRGEVEYPALKDDDIVVVETVRPSSGFTWRDALSVSSTVLSVGLVVLRIIDIQRR